MLWLWQNADAQKKGAIAITTLAGMFLLGAVALHAYMTPVDGDHVYWFQYGQLHDPRNKAIVWMDGEGRTHVLKDGVSKVLSQSPLTR